MSLQHRQYSPVTIHPSLFQSSDILSQGTSHSAPVISRVCRLPQVILHPQLSSPASTILCHPSLSICLSSPFMFHDMFAIRHSPPITLHPSLAASLYTFHSICYSTFYTSHLPPLVLHHLLSTHYYVPVTSTCHLLPPVSRRPSLSTCQSPPVTLHLSLATYDSVFHPPSCLWREGPS